MTRQIDDEIMAELRRRRHEHAAAFGFDLARIVEDWQRQERESGVEHVSLEPRKPRRLAETARPGQPAKR